MQGRDQNPFAVLDQFQVGSETTAVQEPPKKVVEPVIVQDEITEVEQPGNEPTQLPVVVQKQSKPDMLNRILEAYGVAQVYATQIADPQFRAEQEKRLICSNVHGSSVLNIRSTADVENMFKSASNFVELQANLRYPNITVIQGFLKPGTIAFAAYATVREFAQLYGQAGLNEVKWKIGHQTPDDYYAATVARFPTRLLTIQLKMDTESGVEQLHQWFAGPEISSLVRKNDGDVLIRCGVQLQPISSKPVRAKQPYQSRR